MVSVQPVGIASPLQSIEEAPFDLRAHAAGSKPRIELLLIQENADLKRLGDDFMKCLLQQFKRESGASNLGFEKQLSVLQEQAQVLDTKSSLSTLSTISSSVLSLFSLAAGASTANVYLVAAGATGLANTLITYFDGWNWIAETLASDNEQAQGQIRTLMPITLTLMSFALGMNGTQLAGGETQGMLDTFQQLKSYVYGGVEAGKA